MLRTYIRKALERGSRFAILSAWSRLGLGSDFDDFIAVDGNRSAMLNSIAFYMQRIERGFDQWIEGRDAGAALAEALVWACETIDDGKVWHRSLKLRSYVDISVQVLLLRIFVDQLSSASNEIEPREVTAMLVEQQPASRAAVLAHAERLLEDNEIDEAIVLIERALRMHAVCTTAQEMLARAKQARGDADEYDLSDKFCRMPFTHLTTGLGGETFACHCPAWVPFSIGNVFEAGSPDALWNSERMTEIRRSIHDGDFRYCSRTLCSYIKARKLPRKSDVTDPDLRAYIDGRITRIEEPPTVVELSHDSTCNLACPSCRTEMLIAKEDDVDLYASSTERVILPLLKRVKGQTYINGGGEAFASKHFRTILGALNRDEYPGLKVLLITNGQLITRRRWSEFPNLPEMLALVSVSVDAARAETYEKLRRPGKWAPLMKNLEFIASMRRANTIPLFSLNFVVQRDNFREMLDVVALADNLGADGVWFQRVTNYGAYSEAEFADVDVGNPAHRLHAELLAILRNPILQRPAINMAMLLNLVPELIEPGERPDLPY